ncbi:MAG: MipA/OmpV family protein, partial [Gammaproteobacteria bacterium]
LFSGLAIFLYCTSLFALDDDWEVTIGLAPLIAPEYEGADEYRVIPIPLVDVEYKDTYFFNFYRGLGVNVINTRQIQAGPVMTYRLWQDEDSNPALRGLGDIPGTLELGGFINYYLPRVRFGADIKQGVNGHRGAIANFSMEAYGKIGEKIHYAIGPRYAWADQSYMQTYFGIDNSQSTRSGLDAYFPGAGSKEVGVGGFLAYAFDEHWRISTFGRLTRLLDPAADSPIVKDEGTPTQLTLAFSVGYTF